MGGGRPVLEDGGSSPLARGLHGFCGQPEVEFGIIPARAGFTATTCAGRSPQPDHPRSRGVYRFRRNDRCPATGSSPLARGLQCFLSRVRRCGGDHPRSRGVYDEAAEKAKLSEGSSPLARGLLETGTSPATVSGIIPARAGFTHARPLRVTPLWDHPRSRGVYQNHEGGLWPILRIIPARAGFTATADHPPSPSPDHPRSRGVYPATQNPRRHPGGSSPLARGLRVGLAGIPGRRRIIPARAGFTFRGAGSGWPREDHPRSRGVYTTNVRIRTQRPDHPRSRGVYLRPSACLKASGGSSPLARGLPGESRCRL